MGGFFLESILAFVRLTIYICSVLPATQSRLDGTLEVEALHVNERHIVTSHADAHWRREGKVGRGTLEVTESAQ